MARPKKPKYEWVEALQLYRKRIKDADGKYVAIYGKAEDELTLKIEQAKEAIKSAKLARAEPLFKDYAARWIELNTADLAAGTKRDYTYIINNFLIPMFPNAKMKSITVDDIKSGMIPLNVKSASVYNKAVLLLKKIFDSAVENELIVRSPAAKLKRGGVKQKEKVALTNEQVSILLNAVRDTVAYPFCMVGLYAGLRREEILGLKWDSIHINAKAPYISVKRALRWEHNQPVITGDLKSKAAYRDIPIPSQLVECLKSEKQKSKSDFLIANTAGGARSQIQFRNLWGAVRCRMVGERTYYKDKEKITVQQKLGKKCKRHTHSYTIDFEVTPHILRHTYITNLFMAGVDMKTVQYLAGHATVDMTLGTYIHLMENKPGDLMPSVIKAFEVKNKVKGKQEVHQPIAPHQVQDVQN